MRVLWALLLAVAQAKVVTTTVTMSETVDWNYITKFAVDIGSGEYSIRAKFTKPLTSLNETKILTLHLYRDTDWDNALNQETCEGRTRHAHIHQSIHLPASGEWSDVIARKMTQRVRPYYWYFALADCRHELKGAYRVKLEVTVTNADGSHFSLEDRNMEYVYILFLVVFLLFMSTNVLSLLRRFQKTDTLEPPLFMLNMSISGQISSLMFGGLHLLIYAYDGSGFSLFDFFHQTSELGSHLLLTILFLLISLGWVLKYSEFPDLEVYLPVTFLVVVLHLMVAGLGRLADDSHSKYTDYEGISGVLLLIMRFGMWAWFAYNMKSLYQSSQPTLRTLVWELALIGTVYLLSLPVLVLISYFIAPYVRKKVVIIGALVIQMAAFMMMGRLLSEKSKFYKMSTMAGSVLPGAKAK